MSNIAENVPKFHLIVLKPEQQYALRVLLYDYLANYTTKKMEDSFNTKDPATALNNQHMFILHFKRYSDIMDLLTTENDLEIASTKALTIQPSIFNMLLIAVESYNSNDSYLNAEDSKWVYLHRRSILHLLKESKEFTYTEEEINKVKKEEGI